MSDGSSLGIDAERALKTILGGEPQPTGDERQTREQVKARIEQAFQDCVDGVPVTGYGQTADILAGAVLAYFTTREEGWDWPVSGKPDLYGTVKEASPAPVRKAFDECTGFQWGWASNTARWVLDLPEHRNPAIITVGT